MLHRRGGLTPCRVVGEELERRQWTEATLGKRRKGDLEKVKMAVRLRMGSVANVNTLLYQWRQRKQKQ